MTRKDFILIADAIRTARLMDAERWLMARDMADALRGTNSRFDRDKFLERCGVP